MFYIFRNGEQLGPYSRENIETFLKTGNLEYSDLVWEEGWSDWRPIEEVLPRNDQPPAPPSPTSGCHEEQIIFATGAATPQPHRKRTFFRSIPKTVWAMAVVGIVCFVAGLYFETRLPNDRIDRSPLAVFGCGLIYAIFGAIATGWLGCLCICEIKGRRIFYGVGSVALVVLLKDAETINYAVLIAFAIVPVIGAFLPSKRLDSKNV